MTYYKRHIDRQLIEWKDSPRRKPLLIRGARQVGNSTAVRTSLENFGQFDHYDPKDHFEQRHVDIVPLYALSNLELNATETGE